MELGDKNIVKLHGERNRGITNNYTPKNILENLGRDF